MSKQLDDALKLVMSDIEEAQNEETTVKVDPKPVVLVSPSAAQDRITELAQKKQKLDEVRRQIRGAASADDFLDGVIDAVSLEDEMKSDEYDIYGNL
jgi:hypothetical protein